MRVKSGDVGTAAALERKCERMDADISRYRKLSEERGTESEMLRREYEKLKVHYYKSKENSAILSNT
jgi:hypothetical protein